MKSSRASAWTFEELTLALGLYCTLGFTKVKYTKKEVIDLANLINRTPSAVAFKLVNFARLDPELQKKGIKGMNHGSKVEAAVWEKYIDNLPSLAYDSAIIKSKLQNISLEKTVLNFNKNEGLDRYSLVKTRINQSFFRAMILSLYQQQCCITGLNYIPLLVASHISPWSKDELNRMNPQNGLCLNALHDKAFDNFLVTVTPDYHIKVSNKLKKQSKNLSIQQSFIQYEGQKIILPKRYLPSPEFLSEHNKKFNERN